MEVTKSVFHPADYAVFVLSLLVSAGIGVFFAFKDRKNTNTQEILMGGRSMKVFPVALSVFATSMSAATLLGTPAEMYRYGTQYTLIIFAFCLVVPATAYLYVPVFHQLQVTSAYQYLEMRFSKGVRTLGSAIFLVHMLMYMPVVLYAPALALSEVTGFGVWDAVLSIGLVCTFYTSIGGIKAVIWTDVFQAVLMYAAIIVVVGKGAADVGSMSEVWRIAEERERIDFSSFDVDPLVRHSFWSLVLGAALMWTGTFAASQAMVQRYLSIPTLRGAQICLWINLPALVLLTVVLSLCGLVIFAYYSQCDPIGTKVIQNYDQLFPRFVMETLGSFPGVPGLFVSGIFSGALSTISSGVNALSATTLEDFVKAFFWKNISEVWATRLTKIMAVSYGLIAIVLVLIAEKLGGVLQAALTIHGVIGGPMLGIFTLGMFFPFANTWGAASGLSLGLVFGMWFGMGSFVSQPWSPEKPMSYDSCRDLYFNVTGVDIYNVTEVVRNNDHIFLPYRLSYLWISAVGFVAVLFIGSLVSLLTGTNKGRYVDDKLISPIIIFLSKYLKWEKSSAMGLHKVETSTSVATICKNEIKEEYAKDIPMYPVYRKKDSIVD